MLDGVSASVEFHTFVDPSIRSAMKKMLKPVWLFAWLTLLFATITAGYLFHAARVSRPEFVTDIVQQVTQQRYEDLVVKTEAFMRLVDEQGIPDLVSFDPKQLSGTDISLYLLKDNQIAFWSDNTIPWTPGELDDTTGTRRIIRLRNGWYQKYEQRLGNYRIVGLSLIKRNFPYQNEHLRSRFQSNYQLKTTPEITDEITPYPIHDQQGTQLFSLRFNDGHQQGNHEAPFNLLFLLSLSTFFLLMLWLFYLHRDLNPFQRYPDLSLLFFALDAVIIRGLIQYFRFPAALHDLYLFNPQLYASTWLNPTFGDLFLNVITLTIIAWAVYQHGVFRQIQRPVWLQRALPWLLWLVVWFIALAFVYLIRSLILDATLSFNFRNLLSVDLYSVLGLLLMVFAALALLMCIERVFRYMMEAFGQRKTQLAIYLSLWFTVVIIGFLSRNTVIISTVILWGGFSVVYVLHHRKRIRMIHRTVLTMLIIAAGLTWLINHYSDQKEKSQRLILAADYAQKDDPMAEFLFGEARSAIYQDTAFAEMLFHEDMEEDLIIGYILDKYFNSSEQFWATYNFQVTICTPVQKLVIENANKVIDCYAFFGQQVKEMGTMTLIPDLVLIQDQMGQANYLGVLTFVNNGRVPQEEVKIFIELFPKVVPVEVGYLELLVDQSVKDKANLYKYSNARYRNGQLLTSYGKYVYSINLKNYTEPTNQHQFFSKGGYSHLYYPLGGEHVLLISTPEANLLDQLAPFSLFLLAFILFYALYYSVHSRMSEQTITRSNFRQRLQGALFSVIVVSFILIGGASVYYISILNRNKNMDNLREKARSIRIEVEHKLADKAILDQELKPYIQQILTKFNAVFSTDINLYDVNGNLLGSSRQRIFDEGLVSTKMNTVAYREMVIYQKTLLIHEEHIGSLEYLSAYIPFKNNQGNIIAYINLPYFARQSELSDEISSYLMAFVNIYLFLIAITLFFAFFLSDMIAKPLVLIREKIRLMKLGQVNERIAYGGKDEIGDLVHEYNRMIDELERSADLLARSERESAWREMARQVAHEIKNPLTPMKLNLQHLEKTLGSDPQTWRQQFDKFSKVMHQQIESLSLIASAFSDFANMPRGRMEVIDPAAALQSVQMLFAGYPDVQWDIQIEIAAGTTILGDSEQFSRMVINIINNALQAGVKHRALVVALHAEVTENLLFIRITDNGKGIDDEIREKIFLPSFTTKSSGMGLGLAIAYNIVDSMKGTISFTSESDKGTTFTIIIPVSKA